MHDLEKRAAGSAPPGGAPDMLEKVVPEKVVSLEAYRAGKMKKRQQALALDPLSE